MDPQHIRELLEPGALDFRRLCEEALRKEDFYVGDLRLILFSLGYLLERSDLAGLQRGPTPRRQTGASLVDEALRVDHERSTMLIWQYCAGIRKCSRAFLEIETLFLTQHLEPALRCLEAQASRDRAKGAGRGILYLLHKLDAQLEARSTAEKTLNYFAPEILDSFREVVFEANYKEENGRTREARAYINRMGEMACSLRRLAQIRGKLSGLFSGLAVLIDAAHSQGLTKVERLVACIDEVLNAHRHPPHPLEANLAGIASLLDTELIVWALSTLPEVSLYCTEMAGGAGSICIKLDCEDICSKILGRIFKYLSGFSEISRKKSAVLEIGRWDEPASALPDGGAAGCSAEKAGWSLFAIVFRLTLHMCYIEFRPNHNKLMGPPRAVEGLIKSEHMARHLRSLVLSTQGAVNREYFRLIAGIRTLAALNLVERRGAAEGLQEFLEFLAGSSAPILETVKSLAVTLPSSSKKLFRALEHLSGFKNLGVFDLSVTNWEGARMKPGDRGPEEDGCINRIINRRNLPKAHTVALSNFSLAEREYNRILGDTGLVQTRAGAFHCAEGVPYSTEIASYMFKKKASLPLAKKPMLMDEAGFCRWTARPKKHLFVADAAHSPAGAACLVCMDSFKPGAAGKVCILPCGSVFHGKCLERVASGAKRPHRCSRCREELPMAGDLVSAYHIEFQGAVNWQFDAH